MYSHRIPRYSSLITAALSLAIYAMQLLGKISTLAAIVAGVLTVIKVFLDLRATPSGQMNTSGSLSRAMAYTPTLSSFAPPRLHHTPRCMCPSCHSFDHDVTMPMSPLRLGRFAVSTVDTETSEAWRYTSHRGIAGAYLLKTLRVPQHAQVKPFALARPLS